MNEFTKTKKYKKFIIILIALLLFNFFNPKPVKALIELEDFAALPAKILLFMEKGILKILNNIFCNDDYQAIEIERVFATSEGDVDTEELYVFLTPESIIKGKFILFDADIFKDISSDSSYYDYEAGGSVVEGKTKLRSVIAGWYYALRNFAIVALLSVLVYVGIRMILSTIAQDKAKYKSMFKDWLVAVCLVVVMHYMMIGVLNITSLITKAIGGAGDDAIKIEDLTRDISGILTEEYDNTYKLPERDSNLNLTGKIMDLGDAYGKLIVMLGIIIYTIIFAIKYLKREFTIIFLILLGPISCITYPIDKISDGKAQAFNKWLSEFIYNVIIQPFHLLLYVVLVGSAVELANANIIYAIVCFAVMIPAEKFIKEMFGFRDKLGSPLGAMMTGAIGSQLLGKGKGGSSGGKVKKDKDDDSGELPEKVKTAELPGAEGGEHNTRDEIAGGEQRPGGDQGQRQEVDGGVRTRDLPAGEGGGDGNEGGDGLNGDDGIEGEETPIHTEDQPELEAPETENIDVPQEQEQTNAGEQQGTDDNLANEVLQKGRFRRAWDATSGAARKIAGTKPIMAMRNKHNKRVLAKYGTLKHGFTGETLEKKRLWKATKGLSKWAGRRIKGAVTLGTTAFGMATMGLIGTMMGKGKEGVALGAGIGRRVGTKIGSWGDAAASKIGDYGGTFQKALVGKNKEQLKFKEDKGNIERARRTFKDEHEGRLPTGAQLDQTLDDMYTLGHYGVQDSQLEDVLAQYHDNLALYEGDEEAAMRAAIQSAYIAQDYKASDLRDPKKIEQIYNDYLERYQKLEGFKEEDARKYIKNILENAGTLKRVKNIQLPAQGGTSSLATQTLQARGISHPTEVQVQQEEELVLQLQGGQFDDGQIIQLSQMAGNDEEYKIVVEKAIRMRTDWQEGRASTGMKAVIGENPGERKVNQEIIERISVERDFGLSPQDPLSERKVDAIRAFETSENVKKSTRKLGVKTVRDEISDKDKYEMTGKDKKLTSRYKKLASAGADELERYIQEITGNEQHNFMDSLDSSTWD